MRMFKHLDPKLAAITLTAVTITFVYLLTIHIWFVRPLLNIGNEIDTLRQAHQQYQTRLDRAIALQSRLAQRATTQTPDALLTGTDTGVATGQLMQLIATHVQSITAQGFVCSVTNRTPGTPKEQGEYWQVEVAVSLNCPIDSLGRLIYALENNYPYLFIDSLSLRRTQSINGGTMLNGQLTISGFLRHGETAVQVP